MTEEQIRVEMDKALKEVFNTDKIINFQFDLVQETFLKGLALGMKIEKENGKCIEANDSCYKCGEKLTLENRASIALTSNPPKYMCKKCAGEKENGK